MELLSSLNEMSAAEGFPVVLLGALQAFGALALIIGVLLVMDKIYKKKHPDSGNAESDDSSDNDTGENE